jgi:anthranilate phosphoribosyltransferase
VNILQKYLDVFRTGRDLNGEDAGPFLDALIGETDAVVLADIFRAWDEKEISSDEIYEIARIMRERCTKVETKHEKFVDIVGTGGSRNKTFNVSTAAAFVVAGAGVPVAKHGNRAATSSTGSADVLCALGVEPAVDAATATSCLDEIGICFMFAPNFHRLSPMLAEVRRGLGFPTIFNCVGPLCNPAGSPYQLIGVWNMEMVPKMADALARLGTTKSWVVHGSEGLDEISLSGSTFVAEVESGSVRTFDVLPDDFSIERQRLNGIRAETPEQSAGIIREVLAGSRTGDAAESVVVVNAAAALLLVGDASDLIDGVRIAQRSVGEGHAARKLEELGQAVRK